MNDPKGNWYLLTGLILGLGLGLFLSLMVSPVQYIDMDPSSLSKESQDAYRSVIALAYLAEHDLGRAQGRLGLLGEDFPAQALAAQAQQMVAANQDAQTVRALAQLAADLSPLQPVSTATTAPTLSALPTAAFTATQPPTSAPPTPTETALSPTQPALTTTPTTEAQVTLRPTIAAQPTLEAPFALKSQQEVCDGSIPAGLLQVEVYGANGTPLPGVEIHISWNGGEETFYTGLAPEVNAGYADFRMEEGKEYALSVQRTSEELNSLQYTEGCGQQIVYSQGE